MPEEQDILPAPEDLEGVDPLTVDGGVYTTPLPPQGTTMKEGGLVPPRKNTSTDQHQREQFVL